MQLLRYQHSFTPSWKLITLLSSLSVLILNKPAKRMRLKPRHDERLQRDSHLLAFLLFIVRYFLQQFHWCIDHSSAFMFLILPAHASPRLMMPPPPHDARKGHHYYTPPSQAEVFVYSSDAPCGHHGGGGGIIGWRVIMPRARI